MIQLKQFSLQRGTKFLFEQCDLTINPGQRVGIIGANGTGKSSFFAVLKGLLHYDSGDLLIPKQWQIAAVSQETEASQRSALDYVMDGDQPLRALQAALAQAEQSQQGEQIGHLHAQLDSIGGYQAESRAASLLHGLGFTPEECTRPVQSFSGGWRMRLNLAQALMCRSDLLLLDEPTNHLDLEAVLWLEQWLKGYRGTLVLISHDRDFLDNVVNMIVHIYQQKMHSYTGNYSDYERQRAEKLALQQAMYQKQQRQLAHLQQFVDRFRAKATKAKQAQSRLKAIDRMQLLAPAHVDSQFEFEFQSSDKQSNPLLALQHVDVGYGSKSIVTDVSLNLAPGQRIAILGPNGAGKSTLIKVLAGDMPPLSGEVIRGQNLTIAYFAQHQLEQLNPTESALQHLADIADPSYTEQQLRDYLGRFGFGVNSDQAVAPFSGGEKVRLVLALLIWQRPNLLLLDEPTNHLDLEMRHALTVALQSYQGAMVLISHDRHLMNTTADEFWLVANGVMQPFEGDLTDYQQWLQQYKRQSDEPAALTDKVENSAALRKEQKRLDAEKRQKAAPLRKQIEKLDQTLLKINQQLAEIEQQLTDEALYQAQQKEQLKALLQQQTQLQQQKDEVEEQWFELEAQVEAILTGGC